MKEVEIQIPKKPCVYLLKNNDNVIVYIGVSKEKLLTRISAHVYNKEFEKISFIECENIKEAEILESKLIVKNKPKYNKCLTNPNNIGYIGQSELVSKGKELGYKRGQILKKVKGNKDIIQIGEYEYYKKNVFENLI